MSLLGLFFVMWFLLWIAATFLPLTAEFRKVLGIVALILVVILLLFSAAGGTFGELSLPKLR